MPQVIEIDLQETDLSEDELFAVLQEDRDELEFLTVSDKLEYRATTADGSFVLDSVEQVSPPPVPFNSESFSLAPGEPVSPARDQYILNYSFDWSAYRGCRDANDADTTQSSARFSYRNGVVRFEFEEWIENDGE